MHTYIDVPLPRHALTHGCVSEIPDRVLETTFFISWSPEAELKALKRHLSASLSRSPLTPQPGFGCLQANSHPVYSINVKGKKKQSGATEEWGMLRLLRPQQQHITVTQYFKNGQNPDSNILKLPSECESGESVSNVWPADGDQLHCNHLPVLFK